MASVSELASRLEWATDDELTCTLLELSTEINMMNESDLTTLHIPTFCGSLATAMQSWQAPDAIVLAARVLTGLLDTAPETMAFVHSQTPLINVLLEHLNSVAYPDVVELAIPLLARIAARSPPVLNALDITAVYGSIDFFSVVTQRDLLGLIVAAVHTHSPVQTVTRALQLLPMLAQKVPQRRWLPTLTVSSIDNNYSNNEVRNNERSNATDVRVSSSVSSTASVLDTKNVTESGLRLVLASALAAHSRHKKRTRRVNTHTATDHVDGDSDDEYDDEYDEGSSSDGDNDATAAHAASASSDSAATEANTAAVVVSALLKAVLSTKVVKTAFATGNYATPSYTPSLSSLQRLTGAACNAIKWSDSAANDDERNGTFMSCKGGDVTVGAATMAAELGTMHGLTVAAAARRMLETVGTVNGTVHTADKPTANTDSVVAVAEAQGNTCAAMSDSDDKAVDASIKSDNSPVDAPSSASNADDVSALCKHVSWGKLVPTVTLPLFTPVTSQIQTRPSNGSTTDTASASANAICAGVGVSGCDGDCEFKEEEESLIDGCWVTMRLADASTHGNCAGDASVPGVALRLLQQYSQSQSQSQSHAQTHSQLQAQSVELQPVPAVASASATTDWEQQSDLQQQQQHEQE